MAEVGSFALIHEWTAGNPGKQTTLRTESEVEDERNYRNSRILSIGGVPVADPSEIVMLDGQPVFSYPEEDTVQPPPSYSLPTDLRDLERLDDTALESVRVYHLQGIRPSP